LQKRRKKDSGGGKPLKPIFVRVRTSSQVCVDSVHELGQIIKEVEALENPEGYPSCSLFLDLPSRTDYPDYCALLRSCRSRLCSA
jgi:hypothetical protein